jgi:hypothetical protein
MVAAVKPRVSFRDGDWVITQKYPAIGEFKAGELIVGCWGTWEEAMRGALSLTTFIYQEIQSVAAAQEVN